MAFFQGDFPEAHRLLDESVSIGREVGAAGKRDLAHALELLGNVALLQGNPSDAKKLAGGSLQVYQEMEEAWGIAMGLCLLGKATGELGDPVAARSFLEESAALLRVVGDEQALRIRREVGNRGGEGTTLNSLGVVYNALGQQQEAVQYYEQALHIFREEVGDRRGEGVTLNNLGSVYNALSQKQEALECYERALRICREVGDRGGEGVALHNLGSVYNALDRKQEALLYFEQALRIRREIEDRRGEGVTLHKIGMIFSDQGRYEVALVCILLAKALFERVQSPSDVDREVQWIAGLRESIGEKQFTALLARVEPQSERIVEEALRELKEGKGGDDDEKWAARSGRRKRDPPHRSLS